MLQALVRSALGMSWPDAAPLGAFSLAELQEGVGRFSARCAAMLHCSNAKRAFDKKSLKEVRQTLCFHWYASSLLRFQRSTLPAYQPQQGSLYQPCRRQNPAN